VRTAGLTFISLPPRVPALGGSLAVRAAGTARQRLTTGGHAAPFHHVPSDPKGWRAVDAFRTFGIHALAAIGELGGTYCSWRRLKEKIGRVVLA